MKLTRAINNEDEIITFPIERWGKFSNPTLAFMLTQGFVEVVPELPMNPTDEELKQGGIEKARISASMTLLELVAPYRHEERDTWPTQEREAREWLIDNDAPCTMIRRIAYHRQIEMAEMVGKVMENVTLFEYVAGDILGVQQKQIDDLG